MKFSQPTTFLGRNGSFEASGLEINPYRTWNNHLVIVFEPITSRGNIGRCNIEIPIQDIPALIAELKRFYEPNNISKTCHWPIWIVRYWSQDPKINNCLGNLVSWHGKARTKEEAIRRAEKMAKQYGRWFMVHSAIQT
jgi:hypothetical protein